MSLGPRYQCAQCDRNLRPDEGPVCDACIEFNSKEREQCPKRG